jgi:hypothetical protein
MIGKRIALGLALFCIVGLWALPAPADLLTTGTPYYDGVTTWKGTSNFPAIPDPVLGGYVDWVVYAPGQFPFTGYTPTAGEFTYVYQMHSTGTAAVSNYSVGLDNPADNIGDFVDLGHSVTGDPALIPMNIYGPFPGGSASWDFNGINQGGHSCGLVFSSPYKPLENFAVIINHGQYQVAQSVPSPSNTTPEPATIWLLGGGLGLILANWLRRR